MKAPKTNNLFSNKLSAILSKFKESTTVHVGHQQARALFNDFSLRDILTPFLSKMDNCDHLSDRQRREYSKTYLTLVDAYKEEILSEAHYERILESLNRKTAGVSEVVGHICKTLLNRIQDLQQLYPYVSAMLNIFHGHPEIPKIFRQVIETIDSNIISSLQNDILSVLIDRIPNAKNKSEYLEAVQALVLCLQEKLTAQSQVVGLLLKYLRNEDWNCRKTSVEIAYALLVINQQINETVHATIRELKYDKIKHVRDSVNNYEALYKQVYAEELQPKSPNPVNRQGKVKSEYAKKTISRSPAPVTAHKEPREAREVKQYREARLSDDKSNSLEKSSKFKQKNENFFKNAKNSDVIRTNQDNRSSLELQRDDHRQYKQQNSDKIEVQLPIVNIEESAYYDEKNNFQAYLKKRTSPPSPPFSKSPIAKTPPLRPNEKKLQKFESIRSIDSKQIPPKDHNNKFNYESELQSFKKKNKISQIDHIHYQQSPKQSASFAERSFDKSQQQFSISCIENKNEQTHLEEFKSILMEFEKRINSRLDRLEKRIDMIENRKPSHLESLRVSNSTDRQPQSVEVRDKMEKTDKRMQAGKVQPDSPQSYLYNESPYDSHWSQSESQGVESNLEQKVKASIVNENWDQAFTLALTNNRKNILLNLLQRCVFPQDRTVQQCIMLQLRKLLDYSSALKWLKYYLMQRDVPRSRLLKLQEQLLRRGVSNNKNYEMMRQLVLQEIADKLEGK